LDSASFVTIGSPAPDFRAPTSHGQTLDRASFVGKVPVALVFPAPETPDLAAALAPFDDRMIEFGRRRVQVLAVVPESPRTVRELAERMPLRALTLLADPDDSIRTAYGATEAQFDLMERVIPHELALAASPESVADARRYFASVASDVDLPQRVREFGALVVSELVTNAVLHGREPITLRVTTMPRTVRVAVSDGGVRPPVRRRRIPGRPLSVDAGSADHGRGLAIVEGLSQKWGCEPAVQTPGKTVWCDLAVDRGP